MVNRIPKGCDQQGRHPEAAHAASEVDDWQPEPFSWLIDIVIAVSIAAAMLFVVLAAYS
jgi:hypothetical protein